MAAVLILFLPKSTNIFFYGTQAGAFFATIFMISLKLNIQTAKRLHVLSMKMATILSTAVQEMQ